MKNIFLHTNIRKGFTIVEVATVLFVIAILALIATMTYNNVQRQARDTSKEQGVKVIMTSLERYYDDHGEYPAGSELNPNKALNMLTDLQAPLNYLPGLTKKDISNDTYSFYAYCDNTDCNGASWLKYRRHQIIYHSRWVSSDGSDVATLTMPSQSQGGGGCTLKNPYATPSFTLAWYNEDEGVWKMARSNHGSPSVENNATPPSPPQTCTFTQL